MNFVVKDNCYNRDNVIIVNSFMQPFLNAILDELNVETLDHFVISDSTEEGYYETVMEYANLLGTEAHITQDGQYFAAGISLCGVGENGKLSQAIVIKSSVWVYAAYEYLASKNMLDESIKGQLDMPKGMALSLILHEIGHSIDTEKQYKKFGIIDSKVGYDLRFEYDEYAKNVALSLWGEYFAESFASQLGVSGDELSEKHEVELINCISSYSFGTSIPPLLDRVYRILYYFVLRVAHLHHNKESCKNFNYTKYKNTNFISDYIPFLAQTETAILNLFLEYPNWSSYDDLNELSTIFKEFVEFEYKKQNNIS